MKTSKSNLQRHFIYSIILLALTFGPSSTNAADKDISTNEFREHLASQPWTWERPNQKTETIIFESPNSVKNSDWGWEARYTITGIGYLTIKLKKQTTKLVFSEDLTSYTGEDFEGRPLSGKMKK